MNALTHKDNTNTINLQTKLYDDKLVVCNDLTLGDRVAIEKFDKSYQYKPFCLLSQEYFIDVY